MIIYVKHATPENVSYLRSVQGMGESQKAKKCGNWFFLETQKQSHTESSQFTASVEIGAFTL